MRFLIMGGAGFIGSNLVRRLLDGSELNEIIVLDNFFTGSLNNLYDLSQKFGNRRLSIKQWDVTHPWKSGAIDIIYNLACPASPIAYQKTPIPTTMTSVLGTYNGLKEAQFYGARFIQASTSEIYGDPKFHPQTEDYWGHVNTWGPRACYDEGKRVAETLCYDFSKDVDIRVARIFNTYGPYMAVNDGRVVSNFIVQALKDEDITIYGDGTQTRSFCYVDDMIEGLMTLCRSDIKTPVNLGNPIEFTMNELAYEILVITKSDSKIVYRPLPEDDPKQRRPDITKARSLGWEPKVGLIEGLRKTVEYFRGKLHV